MSLNEALSNFVDAVYYDEPDVVKFRQRLSLVRYADEPNAIGKRQMWDLKLEALHKALHEYLHDTPYVSPMEMVDE